jgi:hypothetical protein
MTMIEREKTVIAWIVGGWLVLAAIAVALAITLGGCWQRGEPWLHPEDFGPGKPSVPWQKAEPHHTAPADLGVLDAALEAIMDLLEAAPDEGAWDLEL